MESEYFSKREKPKAVDRRPIQAKSTHELNAVDLAQFRMLAQIQAEAIARQNPKASRDFAIAIAEELVEMINA